MLILNLLILVAPCPKLPDTFSIFLNESTYDYQNLRFPRKMSAFDYVYDLFKKKEKYSKHHSKLNLAYIAKSA